MANVLSYKWVNLLEFSLIIHHTLCFCLYLCSLTRGCMFMRIFKYELFTHCYIIYSQSTSHAYCVSRQHYGVRAKTGWLRTRMCPKGTTFIRGLLFQWADTITIHLRKVQTYQRVIRSRKSKKDRQIQWPKEKSTTEHTNVLLHKYNIVFIR